MSKNQSMKICILSNAMAVHTQRWASAFAERGHKVDLLSIRKDDIPGVTVHAVNVGPANTKSKLLTFFSYLRLLIASRRLIQKLSPDILNAHYVPTHGVIAALSGRHPLVITAWGSDVISCNWPRTPLFSKIIIKFVLKHANSVWVASKFLKRHLESFCKQRELINQIPFGVDCDLFCPASDETSSKDQKQFRIGFVKTLSSKYGPDILMRAMPQILKEVPEAKVIMVGRDCLDNKLKRLSERLSVADRVKFAGFVDNDQLPVLLRSFDVLVNPSVCHESFGVSVLEASACGVPVVASRIGGLPEVCIDGQTGLSFEPGSSKGLAEAVVQLAHNPTLRERAGQAGRKFVVENYNWQDNVDEALSLFSRQVSAEDFNYII